MVKLSKCLCLVWQLSVEDLSSHPTEFQAVDKWMSESHSLYLPNVEEPGHLTHDLASHGYNVIIVLVLPGWLLTRPLDVATFYLSLALSFI